MMNGLVIIPTYNERDNVEDITRAVLELPYGFHLLVVDDNSPDGTGAVADRLAAASDRVHVLHNPEKRGIGPAYITGFRWGLAIYRRGECRRLAALTAPPLLFRQCLFPDRHGGSGQRRHRRIQVFPPRGAGDPRPRHGKLERVHVPD